jgi:RHS repeat-associated protein
VVATYVDDTARARYGTTVNSPFRLLGQVADDDAELCFTRFRCFDPEIGSWISSDPLEIAGGLNLYGFDGAPTDVVDPLGLATGGGNKHVFRGGSDLTVKPDEYKPRKAEGDDTGRGISTWDTKAKVDKWGAHEVVSVPETLEVARRGKSEGHYEIIAKKPGMTREEYQAEVNKIQLRKVE